MSGNKSYNVVIAGATGAVGEVMLEILEEREFPVEEIFLLASERSEGKRLQFRGKNVRVERLDQFDFSRAQIGLFSAGGSLSRQFAPKAAESGCIVIDNTSEFRYDPEVPLVVPEVNGHKISDFGVKSIIANPNCSTIQMMLALKPIQETVGIERINVATYQAVSGRGQSGIKELAGQTGNLLNAKPIEPEDMPVQIAFNVIPQCDDFQPNAYTKEEMKMVWETQKIFEDETIRVNPTCVRVPVFFGHSEAVHVETKEHLPIARLEELLEGTEGVILMRNNEYPTPVTHAAGKDPVYVGRLRKDISHENGINMWVVSDNVRKGAALNTVQIAELLVNNYADKLPNA